MRIAVVIPVWNQIALTQRCLESLGAQSRRADTVIVVDNGSDPDPSVAIRQAYPGATILRLKENRGFAGGCNAGIAHALESGHDAVLLLNNDTVADEHLVKELERGLCENPRIAAVGAKTLTDENPPRIHAAYGVLTFHGSLVRIEGWLEPDINRFQEERDVDVAAGSAVLLRREALLDVGLLDEEFFAYHEDVDWCTRARRGGWRIRYVPTAFVRHRMHASTGGGYRSPITYLAARNSVLFVRKNASLRQILCFTVFTIGNLLKDLRYRLGTHELDGYLLRLRGFRDGILRRPVPLEELGLRRTAPRGAK